MEQMDDIYSLRIEVSRSGQVELINRILGVTCNVASDCWELQTDYADTYYDVPILYITNFLNILEDKYTALESIGIRREHISIWRCIRGAKDVFMQYEPEEMQMMAYQGIRFCIICRVLEEDEEMGPRFKGAALAN